MRVILIGFTKISYMPYMNFYLEKIKELECDVDLIYWDRDSFEDTLPSARVNQYCFQCNMVDSDNLLRKIPKFIKYRKYALSILKKNRYDLVIVLHSTPGVLLSDFLIHKFKGNYVLDYRDFTYENWKVYKSIIRALVVNSKHTFVSSRGYLKFLPEDSKISISHNISIHSSEEKKIRCSQERTTIPIRISFWGLIRHVDVNKNIINRLGNDSRFELNYYGREQEPGRLLREYINDLNIKNVYFHGGYLPDEKIIFVSKTDLLLNVYDNDVKTTYAMGNKYYDGINFYIPQICNSGSFMGSEVENAGIGIMIDPLEDDLADQLFSYYNSIVWNRFIQNCDIKYKEIISEYKSCLEELENLIKEREV